MNKQIMRLTYVAHALVAVLVVMTTYWQTWASAGLAARQDNAIRRVHEFSIDRGLIFSFEPRKRLARNRERPRAQLPANDVTGGPPSAIGPPGAADVAGRTAPDTGATRAG